MSPQPLTLYHNGKVITMDDQNPQSEAVLVAGGRIVAVGRETELTALAPTAQRVNLNGNVLFPGFIEPHSHMYGYGLTKGRTATLYNLNTAYAPTRDDVLQLVADEAALRAPGEWISGRGHLNDMWPDPRFITRDELDRVAPNNPVSLNSVGGDLYFVNSKALELAGITKYSHSNYNGEVYKDPATGEPNGVISDTAAFPINALIPTPTMEEGIEAVRAAAQAMLSMGITTVAHIRSILPNGYGPEQIRPFFELAARGELGIRVRLLMEAYANIATEGDYTYLEAAEAIGLISNVGDQVKLGAIKVIADGWLEGHGSALYEPYSDRPDRFGFFWRPERDYAKIIKKGHDAGFQMAVHCDGPRSIDLICDAFEAALKDNPREDHRHRIEHAPMLNDAQIERIARLGLIVTATPTYRFEPWHKEMMLRRYGDKRAPQLMRYKSLIEAGVTVTGGSDCHPGQDEWLDPISQIHFHSVEGPINASEKLSRRQAVELFTTKAAYANFGEQSSGQIRPGDIADLVILTGDPLTASDNDLKSIKVLTTIVGGEVQYETANQVPA